MKNRVNKKIIKALSVGLAASMALQPVTAFAEEPGVEPAPAQDAMKAVPATAILQDVEEGPADKAQDAADVVSHEAPAPSVEIPVVEADANADTNASAEVKPVDKGGDIQVTDADANIVTEDIAQTAKPGEAGVDTTLVIDIGFSPILDVDAHIEKKDYSQDVIDAAENLADDTNNVVDAKSDIDNVKKDLIIAENADLTEDKAFKDAAGTINDIQKKNEEVEEIVNQNVQTANTLADNIKNASSISDAEQAYEDLTLLASDTAVTVEAYNNALYGDEKNKGLLDKYADAKKLLEIAQRRLKDAVGEYSDEEKGTAGTGARGSVEAAEAKVAAAEKEVEALKTAIKDAKDNIETINKAALEIAWLQEDIKKDVAKGVAVSDKQDVLFEKVMKSYYAKEMLPFGANDINVSKSENGYFAVSYRDVLGFKHDPLYFNYGSNDKGDFIMYPKTEAEVKALDALAAYVKDHPDVSEENKTVYAITKFGEKTVYKVYDEIKDDLVKVGNNYYLKTGDGTPTMTPVEVTTPGINDIANVGGTVQAVSSIDHENERTVYTVDVYGRLYETTYADVTTSTYKKLQTAVADYLKDGYSDDAKKAAAEDLKDNDSDIIVTSVVNKEKTYYVVSGSYFPSFVLTLDNNTNVQKREYTGALFGNKSEQAKQAAINETLNEVINGLGDGYVKVSDTLEAEILSSITELNEDVRVTGSITVKKNGATAKVVTSAEKESEEAAEADFEANVAETLANLQKPGNASISYYYVDEDDRFKTKSGERSVKFEKSFDLQGEISTDEIKKYSYCIEYIKKTAESDPVNTKISQVRYDNVKMAFKILQDGFKNSRVALNVDQDRELNAILDKAVNLFDKYDRYSQEAAKVQADIDQTQADIELLKGAIDEFSSAHNAKTAAEVLDSILIDSKTEEKVSIVDYFKVTDEDIAEYYMVPEQFKEADPEGYKNLIQKLKDELGGKSVNDFVNFLDYLERKAKKKNDEINTKLETINAILDQSEEDLSDTINRLTSDTNDDVVVEDDDDDDDTTGGGEDTTVFIPLAVTPATNVVTPVAENPEAPAVLGARTTRRTAAKSAADTDTVATDNSNGNSDNIAVAGAQKEETKTPEAPKTETTIEETETALAATPELEEKGFAWWWLLIFAAIAGVSVEEYARRKSNKAKAEAKDSTKINK